MISRGFSNFFTIPGLQTTQHLGVTDALLPPAIRNLEEHGTAHVAFMSNGTDGEKATLTSHSKPPVLHKTTAARLADTGGKLEIEPDQLLELEMVQRLVTTALYGKSTNKANMDPREYTKRVLACKNVDDLMILLMQVHPEILQYVGDLEAAPHLLNGLDKMEKAEALSFCSTRTIKMLPQAAIEYNKLAVTYWAVICLLNKNYDFLKTDIRSNAALSDKALDELREFFIETMGVDPTGQLLFNPEKFKAWMALMAIHDVGKIIKFKLMKEAAGLGIASTNHDAVLADLVEQGLDFTLPSYKVLNPDPHSTEPTPDQFLILQSLAGAAKLNLPQIPQGESPTAMLAELHGMTEEELNFFLLHAMFDTYGAAGGTKPNGPFLMASFIHAAFWNARPMLAKASQGNSGFDPLDADIAMKQKYVLDNLDITFDNLLNPDGSLNKERYTLLRLLGHISSSTPEKTNRKQAGLDLIEAFDDLPNHIKNAITEAYSITGLSEGQYGRITQYAPLITKNTAIWLMQNETEFRDPNAALKEAYKIILPFIARVMDAVKIHLNSNEKNGLYMVNFQPAANFANEHGPRSLANATIELKGGKDGVAVELTL